MRLKRMHLALATFILLMLLLSSSYVVATPDGTAGVQSIYDRAVVTGQVTKDITDRNNIFTGAYGDGMTYSLDGFKLRSGEIYDTNSDGSGYGNITADVGMITHTKWNASGLIHTPTSTQILDRWYETDNNNILTVTTGLKYKGEGAPCMRVAFDHGTGTYGVTGKLHVNFSTAVDVNKYFTIGIYVVSNTLNSTIGNVFQVNLIDPAGNYLSLQLGSTDFYRSATTTYERVTFAFNTGRTLLYQVRLTDWDAQLPDMAFSQITSMEIVSSSSSPVSGAFIADIFALAFTDSPIKLGRDREDELTTNEYVLANMTDPTDPNVHLRELDTNIQKIANAQIDFIRVFGPTRETYNDQDFSVSRNYEIKIPVSDDWADQVSFSNLQLYYVLGDDYSKYTSFEFGGTEKSSLLINEGAGDAISLGSITENTLYLLKVTRVYSQSAYDVLIGDAHLSLWQWLQYAFWATAATAIPITAIRSKANKQKRRIKTRAKNR